MLREQMGVRKLSDRRILLPAQLPQDLGKRTLVVDLDETLVHSSFQVLMLTVRRYQYSVTTPISTA
jgi:TFIIF-interacting CTD phosphatase-like protein